MRSACFFVLSVTAVSFAWGAGVAAPQEERATDQAAFTAAPTAVRDNDKVEVRFAVSAATDVEVAIVNAKGNVVRHLAAGLLGKSAPDPLAKDSLAQELTWAGADDAGKAAAGAADGPLSVRAAIGACGNADNTGAPSNGPPIPMACPTACSFADGKLYVSDTANHRVVIVKFDHAAEATVPVP